MKITILGGGFTGLAAAWDLSGAGHEVTIVEKEPLLGGLASGYREEGWDWSLERAYHHIFSNDRDILGLARDTGFGGFFMKSPLTAALYKTGPDNYRTFPVDTPQDFLRLPLIGWPDKLRAAAVLGFLKTTPFLPYFEKTTSEEFLRKTMGDRVWNVLWQELFRRKFGKYAGNILASFIWARISKRTKNLGYVRGGFQAFINHLGRADEKRGVRILVGKTAVNMRKKDGGFEVGLGGGECLVSDALISTLPTPVFVRLGEWVLPEDYRARLSRIKYLHAVNLILETDRPAINKVYWLNLYDPEAPMMVLVQHTNFIDKKYYGGHHVLYAATYVDTADPLVRAPDKQVFDYYVPYIRRLAGEGVRILRSRVFKAPFAQPIFNRTFPADMPHLRTPVKNLYVANLDMTYPYDRGTNYAVKLGREAAAAIIRP